MHSKGKVLSSIFRLNDNIVYLSWHEKTKILKDNRLNCKSHCACVSQFLSNDNREMAYINLNSNNEQKYQCEALTILVMC